MLPICNLLPPRHLASVHPQNVLSIRSGLGQRPRLFHMTSMLSRSKSPIWAIQKKTMAEKVTEEHETHAGIHLIWPGIVPTLPLELHLGIVFLSRPAMVARVASRCSGAQAKWLIDPLVWIYIIQSTLAVLVMLSSS